jgi:UDP-N-acetyl-D-glucosamine/UDP-N-acetyl-D-galactosamine dehydrogenase
MKNFNKKDYKICIVGLGYVGLPLAARFAFKGFNVIGFDTKRERVNQLINNIDVNDDISHKNLEILSKNAKLTTHIKDIKESNVYIVTVPTPINEDRTPNLGPLISASELVGSVIKKNSIVVYESTVYPGVTDDICTPILEEKSKLIFNEDFSTGYSPERIVPGDKVNTIEKIKKIVSASNEISLSVISFLYSSIIEAGIYQASSIKVAEAAKVTENIQRDVNIALINEMHQLYTSLDISTLDVIEAASSKWNFMKLTPGLVGGHCISIDPYYLMHKSEVSGYVPNIMRSARKINDEMGKWVFDRFVIFAKENNIDLSSVNVTILGYTFKENCKDTRNTKVKDLIIYMKEMDINLNLWDPYIEKKDIHELTELGINILETQPTNVEVAFICVYHSEVLCFLETFTGITFDYRKLVT